MKIIDDFIKDEDFKKIQDHLYGAYIWSYQDIVVHPRETEDTFQFCHSYIQQGQPVSSFLGVLQPVMAEISPLFFIRIKANLLTRTPEIVENLFHIDLRVIKEKERLKQWTTAIFYMNTNNGYTTFEDGTKVDSVANRIVMFPSNIKHKGTSCTDKKTRVVINFNYYL